MRDADNILTLVERLPSSSVVMLMVVATVWSAQPAPALAQETSVPTLRAGKGVGVVAIDGRLSEPEWDPADSADAFAQTAPGDGAPPTFRTVVRVLAGRNAIVIGIVCDDPNPDGIVSFSVRRDAGLDWEDHVRIVLGPPREGRSGYVFAVNPSGARYNGLINPGPEGDNAEWDGIWEAATARSPAGVSRLGLPSKLAARVESTPDQAAVRLASLRRARAAFAAPLPLLKPGTPHPRTLAI